MLNKENAFKLCKSISNRSKILDRDIQKVCESAIGYSICYGDITIAQAAFNAVGKHLQPAVLDYMETYGQIMWDKEKKEIIYNKSDSLSKFHEDMSATEKYIEEIETSWEDHKVPAVHSKFDCAKAFLKLVESMQKKVKAGKAGHPELLDKLLPIAQELDHLREPVVVDAEFETVKEEDIPLGPQRIAA